MKDGEPYQGDMGGGFYPFRRDVRWLESQEVPIAPLLDMLEFSSGKRNWSYQLRFGLFELSLSDVKIIAEAMAAKLPCLA